MSTCFQKQVGKRKKVEDEDDENRAAPTTSSTEELMIIEDSDGPGRSERLNKRRRKVDEKDENLEKAIRTLKDFEIPVDESMSRNEVLDLAIALIKSSNQGEKSAVPSTSSSGSSKPSKTVVDRNDEFSDDSDASPQPAVKKNRTKQWQNSSEEVLLLDEDEATTSSMPTNFVKERDSSARKERTHVGGEHVRGKDVVKGKREVFEDADSSPDSKNITFETEEPIPKKERKVSEKKERKRQLDAEEDSEDSQSSQEAPTSRPKKSRNLQLNKRQLENMQAKTSSLLKKTTARLSQEIPVSSDNQTMQDENKMTDEDEDTQAPGSQELFAGETLPMGLPEGDASDDSESSSQPRVLRSAQKKKLPPERFMEVDWPKHIPMKRKQYTKAANQRRLKKNDGLALFAPATKDPVSYSKVIMQMFNLYFRKLIIEQGKLGLCLDWGEPVKPGRHMSRTIDAKGRGQDSYSWSSDEEVAIHSEKSSDDENKNGRGRLSFKSKARSPVSNSTQSKRLLRNNSNESPKGSDSDFVADAKRIQPRRTVATSREPLHRCHDDVEDDDEESLPDYGISSSDKPPEAGQTAYSDDTQPMSVVYPTLVPQTLAMEEDLYMADTETLEPDNGEVQRENDDPSEIQPRRKIQKGQSPIQGVIEDSDDSDLQVHPHITSTYGRRRKSRDSPVPTPSQGSSGSRESGSILNSQGEIKSFQKSRGTFNLDMEDEDSKDLGIDSLLNKREVHDSRISKIKTQVHDLCDSEDEKTLSKSNRKLKRVPEKESSSDSESSRDQVDLGHPSPNVLSSRKGKGKQQKKKLTREEVLKNIDNTSEDDIFNKDNSDVDKSKKGLKVFSFSSDSADDQKPSTSKRVRIIPIVLTEKCEKKTTAVKPLIQTRIKQSVVDSEDSDIQEIKPKIPEAKVTCPMCSKLFDMDLIERHASDCFGHHEVTSTTGDDDATATGPGASVPGTSRSGPIQVKGEHSVRNNTRKGEGDGKKETLQRRIKPLTREVTPCIVCGSMVVVDQIEQHTDQCIAAKMLEAQEGEVEDGTDVQKRRATRSKARENPSRSANAGQSMFIEIEDIESASSEASNDQDPDWTEASATSTTEQESPLKFKKISQLEGPIMDFKNQFKSKQGSKRGAKKGGNSRGRGKK